MEYIHTDKDGNQVKYTEEMIKNLIVDLDYQREKSTKYYTEKVNIKDKVYEFFKDRYDTGDEEITCSVEDVNELLESIGSDKLKSLYTVTGRIDFTVVDVEADSEEDAREAVESWLTLEYNGEGSADDWSIETIEASAQ